MSPTRRISMWSGPRNISTALMYGWRSRSDTRVFDEPLYAHFLRVTGRVHPGRDEVLAAMDTDGERVVQEVLLAPASAERPVRFFKNMAHHFVDLDPAFLGEMDHVLLVRDPREVLTSVVKQIPDVGLADTGLPHQVELLDRIRKTGRKVVLLDSKAVLLDPRSGLERLCAALDLPFEESMLSWEAGPKAEDGVWAPHWYHRVHESTGFKAWAPKTEPLPRRLEPLWEACQPLYEHLLREATGVVG